MAAKSDPKNSDFKNNVTRFLDSKKIAYTLHLYDYEAGVHSAVVGLPAEQVFKTLVVRADDPKRKPILVVIPGPDTLDLKALAKALNLKKVQMTTHAEAESLTGLQTGGISPLALINKGFDIYLDEQAQAFETIAVSAAQRGANVQLAVKELVVQTRARFVKLK